MDLFLEDDGLVVNINGARYVFATKEAAANFMRCIKNGGDVEKCASTYGHIEDEAPGSADWDRPERPRG